MIKTSIRCLALLGLLTATTAFADTQSKSSGYYSAAYSKAAKLVVPATNIAVLNYSDDVVFAYVPGASVTLYSGNANTFRHESYWGDTQLTLQDPVHNTFFNQYVCHRAVVTIDGRPGYYRTTVDRRYC
jgi:hypothetical protein